MRGIVNSSCSVDTLPLGMGLHWRGICQIDIKSFTADFDTVGQESEHEGRKMAFSVEICEQIFSM